MFGSLAPYWDVSFHEADSGVGMQMLRDGDWMPPRDEKAKNCIPVPKNNLSSILVDRQIKAGVFCESLISEGGIKWVCGAPPATILGGKEE